MDLLTNEIRLTEAELVRNQRKRPEGALILKLRDFMLACSFQLALGVDFSEPFRFG